MKVTVAPATGFTRPVTVALSEMAAPSNTFGGNAIVASVGVARMPFETIADSFGALQMPVIGGLFPSPL